MSDTQRPLSDERLAEIRVHCEQATIAKLAPRAMLLDLLAEVDRLQVVTADLAGALHNRDAQEDEADLLDWWRSTQ